MKGRKHVIDSLEGKVTDLEAKLATAKQWNYQQMGFLEAKENSLEAALKEVKSKNEEMNTKAKDTEQQICNVKGKLSIIQENINYSHLFSSLWFT